MEKVTGIGGIFFKAQDPDKIQEWYAKHLGIEPSPDGCVIFKSREDQDPARSTYTVWSPFPKDTDYFNPSKAPFMINYRVANLNAMLDQLRKNGVALDERIEESEFGRFAWVMDPEGNRIELWEPPAAK